MQSYNYITLQLSAFLDCVDARPAPDIAIEWRDVEIEIKYCGGAGDSQHYVRSAGTSQLSSG